MNPFNLPGPAFLIFYWLLAAIGLELIHVLRSRTNSKGDAAKMISDPYMIAYLREGYPEIIRVALLNLVQEGVVAVKDREFSLAPPGERSTLNAKRPAVEEQLIAYLGTHPATVDQIVDRRIARDGCIGYRLELEEQGFLRSASKVNLVLLLRNGVAFLLAVVAMIKLIVAISRGHHNVFFLVVSAIVAIALVLFFGARSLEAITERGQRALDATEALLAGARERLKTASATLRGQELAWIAATFGLSVFNYTEDDFAFWPALAFSTPRSYKPVAASSLASNEASTCGVSRNSSSCGSSGSSCGSGGSSSSSSCSSSGSSCGGGGSSCGGGGCGGGGCGGCGGG